MDKLLRMPEVQRRVPLSRSHIYSLAAQGRFPKPIKLGIRASAWLESEVDARVAQRIRESRASDQTLLG